MVGGVNNENQFKKFKYQVGKIDKGLGFRSWSCIGKIQLK